MIAVGLAGEDVAGAAAGLHLHAREADPHAAAALGSQARPFCLIEQGPPGVAPRAGALLEADRAGDLAVADDDRYGLALFVVVLAGDASCLVPRRARRPLPFPCPWFVDGQLGGGMGERYALPLYFRIYPTILFPLHYLYRQFTIYPFLSPFIVVFLPFVYVQIII